MAAYIYKNSNGGIVTHLISILGFIILLAVILVTSFLILQRKSFHKVAEQAVKESRLALAASLTELSLQQTLPHFVVLKDSDKPFDSVTSRLLPGFRLPPKVELTFSNNPNCNYAGCTIHSIMANSCEGKRVILWERYGDGSELYISDLPSSGC
jgi:hypothetical protein